MLKYNILIVLFFNHFLCLFVKYNSLIFRKKKGHNKLLLFLKLQF